MGMRKRTAMRFQVEELEVRLAPGGASGCGGDISRAPVAPPQVHVVAYGSSSIRAGQEGNAPVAGITSAVQKVRE